MSYSIILNSNDRANPTESVNDAIYNFNWDALEEAKYKVSWKLYKTITVVINNTEFETLLMNKPPWGQYSASSWVADTNTLTDLTGNNRHATTSGVTLGSAAEFGAAVPISYLNGASAAATIAFPAGSLPAQFTICSITRNSNPTPTAGGVLQGTAVSYLHGWWENLRGVIYQNGAWITPSTSTGTLLNWLNMCHSNSAATSILADTVSRGVSTGTTTAGALSINIGTFAGAPFQFSQLLIWDQALTAAEIDIVSDALNTYLATGAMSYTVVALSYVITPLPTLFTAGATILSSELTITSFTGEYAFRNGTYIVSSDTVFGNSNIWAAFNALNGSFVGDQNNCWLGSNGAPTYLQLQLPFSCISTYYTLLPWHSGNYSPTEWYVYGSTDGNTWTTLDHQTIGWATFTLKTFTFTNTTSYNYYRLQLITTTNGYNGVAQFNIGV